MTDTSRTSPRFTAGSVPGLRRELADFYGSPRGTRLYFSAILADRQPLRPPGPPEQVAPLLAASEATRLREGDLWYVDDDLCAVLEAAHPSMPAFAPQPHDLPARVGFAVFAEPIANRAIRDEHGMNALVDQLDATLDEAKRKDFREARNGLDDTDARVVAVSWRPVDNPNWSAGGVWLSFYTESAVDRDLFDDPEVERRARAMLPTLIVDNEAAIAWRPEDAPVDGYTLPGPDAPETTISWARLVFATFQLAAQENMAETVQERTIRPERRRTQHAGLPERDVRVIRLRRGVTATRDAEEPADGGRAW
jgi:hypothetical protein